MICDMIYKYDITVKVISFINMRLVFLVVVAFYNFKQWKVEQTDYLLLYGAQWSCDMSKQEYVILRKTRFSISKTLSY